MALITPGTKCAICGELIAGRSAVSFPHFSRNRKDPLFLFTDATVHRDCFEASPLRDQVRHRVDERKRRMKDRSCAVCGHPIKDDWYTTGHLTDDPSDPLFEFNYVHLHLAHLSDWPKLERFRALVLSLEDSGRYEGPSILPSV